MSECKECGHDPQREADSRETQSARLHHFRHALYLACGDDAEKVQHFMRLAEDQRITH